MYSNQDKSHLRHAIGLAKKAEQEGNLPIGAVIALDDKVVAEGRNTIYVPTFNPNRHAEIEALRAVPEALWSDPKRLTLYTTLEPCIMCTGAILLHHIGRVVFGALDPFGGAGCIFGHMPAFVESQLEQTEWIGPALPQECNELCERTMELVRKRQEAGYLI